MKKLLVSMFLFALSCTFVKAQTQTPAKLSLEASDVYLQVDIGRPYYITSASTPEQVIHLGEDLKFWITLKPTANTNWPCTTRNEIPCHVEFRVVDKDTDRSKLQYSDHESRLSDEFSLNLSYPILRDSTLGKKVFIFRVRYQDQILYTFEAPLEVKE